ncbi:hypothetical protein ACEWY4_026522 [Coilia grayii]|uniref:Anoctamin n=1 Tax=Coilia grayii TaxID=363190 RepID=A0ABD1IPS4_9TELE
MEEYDYILVAKKGRSSREVKEEVLLFVESLREKNMEVTEIELEDKVFYAVLAPSGVFEKYKYLLKVSDACNWSEEQRVQITTETETGTSCCGIAKSNRRDQQKVLPQSSESGEPMGAVPKSTRIRMVHFLLEHSFLRNGEKRLISKRVFKSMYCLHEKVALYYLWLGWYTFLLLPAAIVGVIIFLYGLAFFRTSPLIQEVCESDIIMCPRCDKRCEVWKLADTCSYAKVSHLFDNEGTVAFAMFMAIWATVFLELWKRHRAKYVSEWNVFDWSEEEEELIMEIVNDLECKPKEFKYSYRRSALVLSLTALLLAVIIGLTQALVMFRVVARVLLADQDSWPIIKQHANIVALVMGAALHFLTMQVMKRVNRWMAFKLCDIERCRSYAATERSFTVKMFTFQFCTGFSSLIYIAFFLGRINGYPGDYTRIAGKLRLEECHPSGCVTDLFIQMAVILVLKQTLNNIVEFTIPRVQHCFTQTLAKTLECSCDHCNACEERSCDTCKRHDWIMKNYYLNDVHSFKLFDVYVDMVMQFSFTTIFVAAFPLAPLLAFINNLFEIRGDANRMVCLERRLVPRKTNDIGIWMRVLEVIGVLAVIANGLVIGISSDFIPRLVYRYHYGPCANGTVTNVDCMAGYIRSTLSVAHMSDKRVQRDFTLQQMVTPAGHNVTQCSYKDYRSSEDYSLTSQYWFILAIRFAFVILFEHVVVLCKFAVAWFIPDLPVTLRNSRLKDKMQRLKAELSDWEERRVQTHSAQDAEHTHTTQDTEHTHTTQDTEHSHTTQDLHSES